MRDVHHPMLVGLVPVVLLAGCASGTTPLPSPELGSMATPAATAFAPSLSGRVTDENGQPLDSVVITFTGKNPTSAAFTGPDGSYTAGLPAGNYTVQFSDFLHLHAGGYLGSNGLVTNPGEARSVSVGTATTVVNAVLPTGHAVTGRLVGADGVGVAGYLVELVDPSTGAFVWDGGYSGDPAPLARTAADGTFAIDGAGPGPWTLAVQDPDRQAIGYVSAEGGSFMTGGQRPTFLVASDVHLPVSHLPTDFTSKRAGRRVTGRVTDGHGVGVGDVSATLAAGNSVVASCTSAADGTYVLGNVAPGSYAVQFLGIYSRQAGGQIDTTPIVVGTSDVAGVDASPWLPDRGLWTSLPTEVAGVALAVAQFSPWANDQILAKLGKTKADVIEVAEAHDRPTVLDTRARTVAIDATRIRGTDAAALRDGWSAWERDACPACTEQVETLDGKTVVAINSRGSEPLFYAYARDDVMYEVSARTPGLARAAMDALP